MIMMMMILYTNIIASTTLECVLNFECESSMLLIHNNNNNTNNNNNK